MRLLALDLGTKKCGIAISDPLQIISQSLETFFYQKQDFDDLINHLINLINEMGPIEKIILGIPKTNFQDTNPMTKIVLNFKSKLEQKLNYEIVLINESYSSKWSDQIMSQMNLSNKQKKASRDKLAAQKILSDYLMSK